MCKELQSNALPLFMLCNNGKNDSGTNRDKWVPRPSSKSSYDERMYYFVGKLMGLAIRTKSLLDLNLAPLVWKRICNIPLQEKDILAVDAHAFQITGICEEQKVSAEEMQELQTQIEIFDGLTEQMSVTFEIRGSDGNMYSLIPNGSFIPVTHKNVHKFKAAYHKFRLEEFDFACFAMRRGLATVIPIHYLNILTWSELEKMVCGNPIIDVDLLKRMTSYSNCDVNDAHIRLYWDMVRHKMTDEVPCYITHIFFCLKKSKSIDSKPQYTKYNHNKLGTL
ncbi:hypothetical protein RFI_07691 [Reticulomyxa filosa]|uniref:HECT domain-containing protein n=1 Tax=Reticulomyxa filosa TaxID=46433 RepID=X6NTX4_RETFI|nr:hypothetical protein RFI_07691 [Reticulomyxa filosa]|eukprot:ETO29431.1 hypothetical protein RFI_07691 [Reticulomyxa filosa]